MTTPEEFKNRLRKMESVYKDALERRDTSFDEWEDGQYKFQVQQVELMLSRSNRLNVHIQLYCLEGIRRGSVYHKYFNLETDGGLGTAVGFLKGIEARLPEAVTELGESRYWTQEVQSIQPTFMGTLKTNQKGFQNLWVRNLEAKSGNHGATPEEIKSLFNKGDLVQTVAGVFNNIVKGEVQEIGKQGIQVKFEDGDILWVDVGDIEPCQTA